VSHESEIFEIDSIWDFKLIAIKLRPGETMKRNIASQNKEIWIDGTQIFLFRKNSSVSEGPPGLNWYAINFLDCRPNNSLQHVEI